MAPSLCYKETCNYRAATLQTIARSHCRFCSRPLNEDLIECNALGSSQTERILFKISAFRLIREWRPVIMKFLFYIATKLRSKKLLVQKRLPALELLKTKNGSSLMLVC